MKAARPERIVTGSHTTRVADRKFAELGGFIAARRAEVTPQEVGLPNTGSRRLSGLRREEVAMLAGIGASWYTWIEQGRAKNVSPNVLAAIADVLRLNQTQREYMMRLAGYASPTRPNGAPADDCELGLDVVDSFMPYPAYALDRYWDIVLANRTAVRLLGIEGQQPNYLDLIFSDARAEDLFPRWEADAADAVARFRAQTAELLGDPRLDALVARLRETSPVFAELWDRHDVSDQPDTVHVLHHEELGHVPLLRLSLDVTSRPGLQLILLRPQSDEVAERLSRWAATAGMTATARAR